jgi:hypothetical protein
MPLDLLRNQAVHGIRLAAREVADVMNVLLDLLELRLKGGVRKMHGCSKPLHMTQAKHLMLWATVANAKVL